MRLDEKALIKNLTGNFEQKKCHLNWWQNTFF